MADSIFNLVAIPANPVGGSSPTSPTGPSCPIFYPADLAALAGLSTKPPVIIPGGGPSAAGIGNKFPGLNGIVAELDETIRYSILVTGGPKTVLFYGTRIDANGEPWHFSQEVTGNSATVAATALAPSGAGLIQAMGASAVGGIGAATIYVLAELGDIQNGAFVPRAQLLSGLLTGFGVVSGTTTVGGGGGGGGVNTNCWVNNCLFAFPSTLHWIQDTTVTAGTVHRCMHVDFQASMSSAVKNRTLKFILATEGGAVWEWDDPVFLTAGQNRNYTFNFGTPYQSSTDALGNVNVQAPLPTELIFNTDWEIDVGFANPDAGDLVVTPSYCWQVQTC